MVVPNIRLPRSWPLSLPARVSRCVVMQPSWATPGLTIYAGISQAAAFGRPSVMALGSGSCRAPPPTPSPWAAGDDYPGLAAAMAATGVVIVIARLRRGSPRS